MANRQSRYRSSLPGGFHRKLVGQRNRRTTPNHAPYIFQSPRRFHQRNTHHPHHARQSSTRHPRYRNTHRREALMDTPPGIQPQEDKQQDGKSPKRGSSITEQRQGNADDRRQPQYHTYINKEVKEENTEHTISIHTDEAGMLPFRQRYQT